MDDVKLLPGHPGQSQIAGGLIYATGDYFFDHVFGGDGLKFDILSHLYKKKRGIFSHRHATVATINDEVVGIEHGYNARQKRIEDPINTLNTIAYLLSPKLFRMYLRGRHTNKFIKKIPINAYYIAHLAVKDGARGKGIGTKLLNNAFEQAVKSNYKNIFLDVSMKNKAAASLYERKGFKIIEEVRHPKLENKYGLHGQYRMIKELK